MVVAAHAADVVVGGQLGLMAWQRAGDHAALIAPQALASVRAAGPFGATAEMDVALALERNQDVRLVTWPLRLMTTVDVVVRRRRAAWVTGVGPGLSWQISRLQAGDARYAGVTMSPVLRVRTSIEAPLSGQAHWRVATGLGARRGGVDWDTGVGVVVAL